MKKMLAVLAFIAYFCSPIKAINSLTLELDSIFLSGNFLWVKHQIDVIREGQFETDELDVELCNLYELMVDTEWGTKIESAKRETTKARIIELFGEDSRTGGLVLLQTGEYTQAAYEELEKAAQILSDNCGEESWEYAFAELRMGACLMMLRQNTESLAHFLKARTILETMGLENHWLYAKGLAQGASVKTLAKEEGAIDDACKAVDIVFALGDDGISPSIEIYGNVVFVFMTNGHMKEAIDAGVQLKESMEILKLTNNVNYISNIQNMATAYYHQGDHKTAKAKFLECKAMYDAIGETASPNYKNVEAWLKALN